MVRTVLVVDDHAGFRELARALLEDVGYAVVAEAPDGASALGAVRTLRPDAVLLDVHLPDMDGFAVADALSREQPAPLVVLTSTDADEEVGSLLRRSGALRFVAKDALASAQIAALWEPARMRSTVPDWEAQRMRVVIGEDQVLLREGIVRLLEEAGFEVVGQAGDAVDLRRKVGAHRPDVAVVDIQMPPTNTDDGLRAAIHIRSAHPATRVLVLSQYVEERYAVDLIGECAEGVGYLLKDRVGDLDEFAEAVRRVGEGGSVLDPEVVTRMLNRNRRADPVEGPQPARARRAGADGPGPLQQRDRRAARDHRERRREARDRDLRQARSRPRLRGRTAACSRS